MGNACRWIIPPAISFRPDPASVNGLNVPGIFTGAILNREHISKTSDDLITIWNAGHADDPVTITD